MNNVNDSNKYYYVPSYSKEVKVGDRSLYDILVEYDFELVSRIRDRNTLFDSAVFAGQGFPDTLKKYDLETEKMFKSHNVPYKIVLCDDGNGLSDLVTKYPATCDADNYLNQFAKTGEEVVDIFYKNENYPDMVKNFFKGRVDVNNGSKSL